MQGLLQTGVTQRFIRVSIVNDPAGFSQQVAGNIVAHYAKPIQPAAFFDDGGSFKDGFSQIGGGLSGEFSSAVSDGFQDVRITVAQLRQGQQPADRFANG